MAIQFLLVLFFEAENDLNGTGLHGGLPRWGAEDASGVLEYVRRDSLAIHGVLGDTFLVATHLRVHQTSAPQHGCFLNAPD